MAKSKLKSSSVNEQDQILKRLLDALRIMRRYAPRITLAGCELLIFIARETANRERWLLPRLSDISRRLDLSHSGASRLLQSLTVNGREGRTPEEGGFGLVETLDDIKTHGPKAYVLTEEGRKCVEEVRDAIAGKPCGRFEPHDSESLFKLLIKELPQRPKDRA